MKKTLVILFVAGVLAACKSTDSNKSDYQYKDVPFTSNLFFFRTKGITQQIRTLNGYIKK